MQGLFYDKPMRIAFAKEKPDVAKKDGTFKPRERSAAPAPSAPPPPAARRAGGAAPDANGEGRRRAGREAAAREEARARADQHGAVERLFAQALPDECNDQMLAMLFQQYGGFREVRMVPGKRASPSSSSRTR